MRASNGSNCALSIASNGSQSSAMVWANVLSVTLLNCRDGAGRCSAGVHPSSPMSGTNRIVGQILAAIFMFGYARDPNQFLNLGITSNRDHKPAADLELRLQRLRDCWATSRDDDAVIGCMFRPAFRAVAVQHMHIAVAQVGERRCGLFRQLADAFDRVHVGGDLGEDS